MSSTPGQNGASPQGVAATVQAAFLAGVASLDMGQVAVVAEALAARLGTGGLLCVLGSGHSQLIALEGFCRAGTPAWVVPLLDDRLSPARGLACSVAETRTGLGAEVISHLLTGEVRDRSRALLVVSTSGRTAVAVEAAEAGRGLGLLTLALTARHHDCPLAAAADHVLATGVPGGDAATEVGGVMMAPQSTVRGVVLLHALLAATEALRSAREVLVTDKTPAGAIHNRELLRRYPHLASV